MMFCSQCGLKVKEGFLFCPKCGNKLPGAGTQQQQPAPQPAAQPEPQSALQPAPQPEPQAVSQPAAQAAAEFAPQPTPQAASTSGTPAPKRKRTKIVVGVVVAALVLCGAIGGGLWWKADQDAKIAAEIAQAEWERTHVTRVTRLAVEAPAFDDSSTGIPVQVTGTDLDGNAVDEIQYLHASDCSISTLPGNYNVTFPGGYFTGDGTVVKAPDTKLAVEVPVPAPPADEAASSGSQSSQSSQSSDSSQSESANDASDESIVTGETPVFTPLNPLDVTDDLLKVIVDLAKSDPKDDGRAERLQQIAADIHAQAVAEEERRKAEEEQRRREEAERAAAIARLDGWWVTLGQSGSVHYHFHGGTYDVYNDGSVTNSPAKKTGSGTVHSATRMSAEDVARARPESSGAWYFVTDSGGFMMTDEKPDFCDYFSGYPPQGYSGSGSIGRADPPANVLAIAG